MFISKAELLDIQEQLHALTVVVMRLAKDAGLNEKSKGLQEKRDPIIEEYKNFKFPNIVTGGETHKKTEKIPLKE